MEIKFEKYQGTGNDFIIIDDRMRLFPDKDVKLINQLCDRKFGIGADGLILLRDENDFDFRMIYFNADGNESSMCGNGGRCIVAFAHSIGIVKKEYLFIAIDGPHEAIYQENEVSLKMSDLDTFEEGNGSYILNTGSPHYVTFVDDINQVDVFQEGKKIRYAAPFKKEGINVNFVSTLNDGIQVATYERGVEDETLSCGTGVTACGIIYLEKTGREGEVNVNTKGGNLKIKAKKRTNKGYSDIWLTGPAKHVFSGKTKIQYTE